MKKTNKKLLQTFFAVLVVILLQFSGVRISHVQAAVIGTSKTGQLQPATGQSEYRATDSTGTVDAAATDANSTEAVTKDAGSTEGDPGLIGLFGLNWKLFLAQLINFSIVVFVLWKWVFKPVTSGLSDRTAKIEQSLEEAEKVAKDRTDFEGWKQGEISQVRTEASGIITQAKRDAEQIKIDTLEKTKQEQAKLVASAQAKLEQEKLAMLESVKDELAGLVVSATESVLKQKLDSKKDAALIEQALKEAKTGATVSGGRA